MSRYALVAAADFNQADFLARFRAGCFDAVVALDGGFVHCQAVGVEPTAVLGDFDSLGFVPDHPCVVRHPEHKDASDLELGLEYAVAQGAQDLTVYGCLGGRLDHTLAALQNLADYAERGFRVTALGCGSADSKAGFQEGFALSFVVGPGERCFEPTEGKPLEGALSVFAATDVAVGVCEDGLEYSLQDATLTNRTSLGLSNQFTGGAARVSVEKGTLCLMYPSWMA